MGERLLLFAMLLVIPVFALGVGYQIDSTFESKWREEIKSQFPDVDNSRLDAMPLKRYCGEVKESRELPICKWFPFVQLLQRMAVSAIALGLFLVFAIFVMGRVSQDNRKRLLLFFKPGLYLTLIALVGLSLLHSGLFLAAITMGQIAVLDHLMIYGLFLIVAVGFGAAVCVLLLLRALVLMLKSAPTIVRGRVVSHERAPSLWKYISELAAKIDALPPQNIVVGLDCNFYVVDTNIRCFSGNLKGQTLYLSLPLCRILQERELRGIVGHELAHFKGEDTEFSRRFAPIYRGATESLCGLQQNISDNWASIGMRPPVTILSYFFECFATAANQISRKRELAADQIGIQLSDRESFASALVKTHAFDSSWENARLQMREELNQGKAVINVSAIFADYVAQNGNKTSLLGLDNECFPHPMDTHPPLKVRLEAIGATMRSVESAALVTNPEDCAVKLIDHYEEIETELTKLEQVRMEKTGEVRQNPQLRCPACGRLNPVSAESCDCGFRFGRSMG